MIFEKLGGGTPRPAKVSCHRQCAAEARQYLMEDFFSMPGGLPGLNEPESGIILQSRCQTRHRQDPAARISRTPRCFRNDVIRTRHDPIYARSALGVLKGNRLPGRLRHQCPEAPLRSRAFLMHTGPSPSLVFSTIMPSMKKAIRTIPISTCQPIKSVISAQCPRSAGPDRAWPELACMPIPHQRREAGACATWWAAIGNAAHDGTTTAACILHVAHPESYIGGPAGAGAKRRPHSRLASPPRPSILDSFSGGRTDPNAAARMESHLSKNPVQSGYGVCSLRPQQPGQ